MSLRTAIVGTEEERTGTIAQINRFQSLGQSEPPMAPFHLMSRLISDLMLFVHDTIAQINRYRTTFVFAGRKY